MAIVHSQHCLFQLLPSGHSQLVQGFIMMRLQVAVLGGEELSLEVQRGTEEPF